MTSRNTKPALCGLIAAALLAAACGDPSGPIPKSLGAPEYWFHPPPQPQLHLVLTVSPAGGTLPATGCVLVPGTNTFSVTATVRDEANNVVTDIDGNSVGLAIEHDANPLAPIVSATLCGTTTAVIAGGVATFPVLGIDLAGLPDLYTLKGIHDGRDRRHKPRDLHWPVHRVMRQP